MERKEGNGEAERREREWREKEKKILALKTKHIVKPRNKYTGLDSDTAVTGISLKKENFDQMQKGSRQIQ